MDFYNKEISETLGYLDCTMSGLSDSQAEERLDKYGANELVQKKSKSLFVRFLYQFVDPMIIVLLAAALVSFVLAVVQNDSFVDVIIILFVVIVNAVLGVYQESKAEEAIEALKKMSAPHSKVLRNGDIIEIASSNIVPGDIVYIEAGDQVPADGRLVEASLLKIDESALTGESVAVNKLIDLLGTEQLSLADRKNMVYMGTTVAYGRGSFVVTSTGMDTEIGKIASALDSSIDNTTPLQQKMAQLSKFLTYAVIAICIVVFAIQIVRSLFNNALDINIVLDSFMVAVSLAVAAIPEGLPAVVTVVLSIGVTKMSKKNAIIRKLSAVETLGCAQIICTDKTGTLTQNKMTVVEYFSDDEQLLKRGMAYCNDAKISNDGHVVGEPTEAALLEWAKDAFEKNVVRSSEIPFDSSRKMMSVVVDGVQYTKGAPDVIINNCNDIDKNLVNAKNKEMADQALRVLALAVRKVNASGNAVESDMTFIGLVGMKDPIRPEVNAAIERCLESGVKPIMITGDNINTAVAIAKELGIYEKAITGSDLDNLSDDKVDYKHISVYARVQPEHKTRIVNAWQKLGYVVGMSGDGVNDAPSIKTADIGIGMGITGTDVTKNVADMILSDDNFATIVNAIEEGRRVYDNIKKAIQFLLGSNTAEVFTIFVASLIGFTILKPVHLLWVNLVTDCFPALALGLEEAEPGIMKRKPRSPKESIFAHGMGFDILYQGLIVSILVFCSYYIGFGIGGGTKGMTMAFFTMCMTEIFHSFNMRSQRKSIFTLPSLNKWLIIACFASLAVTTAVCEVPFLVEAFSFSSLSLSEYAIAVGIAFIIIPVVEIVKLIQRSIYK